MLHKLERYSEISLSFWHSFTYKFYSKILLF